MNNDDNDTDGNDDDNDDANNDNDDDEKNGDDDDNEDDGDNDYDDNDIDDDNDDGKLVTSFKNHELSSWSPVPPIADNLHVNLTWKIANLSQQLACQLDHATCWQIATCQLELAT